MRWLLFFASILFFLTYYSLRFDLHYSDTPVVKKRADIVFYQARFKEVDVDSLYLLSFAQRGELFGEHTYLHGVRYSSKRIASLQSNEAIDWGDRIELKNSVDILTVKGSRLQTEAATYQKKKERLHIPVPFLFTKKGLTAKGESLVYDAAKGIAKGKNVYATIQL